MIKTIRVVVTKKDIAEGVPESPQRCPIALSLKRRGFLGVAVGRAAVKLGPRDEIIFWLPEKAKKFTTLFDTAFEVSPFWFDLEYIENDGKR